MELPLEEGYVYGKKPRPPQPVPDIDSMFEAVGIPKGKLGELPKPKDWYAGAKERARLRDVEMEGLFARKDELRTGWVDLVADGLCSWGDRIDVIRGIQGPTLGLAEMLARAAHERPHDVPRIERLDAKAEQAMLDQTRLRAELDDVRKHVSHNDDQILKKEAEDRAAEADRIEQKRLEAEKKARAERALARQAALLRGEEWEDEEEELVEERPAEAEDSDEAAADASPRPPRLPGPLFADGAASPPPGSAGSAAKARASFLAEPSTSPSPELRGGLGRQLPPLASPPGSAGAPSPDCSPLRRGS